MKTGVVCQYYPKETPAMERMLNSHSTFSQGEYHCALVLRNLKSASKKLKANILWKL